MVVVWPDWLRLMVLALVTSSMVNTEADLLVSSVKFKLTVLLTLPATSVWRAITVLLPSLAAKVAVQVLPSVLYSSKAPLSRLPVVMVPWLVILSLLLKPLSQVKLRVGVATVLSMVKAKVCAVLVLPAASVAITLTVPLAMACCAVTDHTPPATTVLSTSPVPGMVTVIWSPLLPVPLKVGVSSLVTRSAVLPLLLSVANWTVKVGARVSTA